MALGAVILAYTVLTTQSGQTLHWSPATAPYSMNQQCSPDIANTASCFQALEASFDAWNAVANFHYHTDCLTQLDVSSINPSHTSGGEKTDGQSIVTWVQSSWPYGAGTIAITFNWFIANTGEITESDMMANGQDYTWTDGDTGVQTDVADFLTHEAGHYLGMGHSTDPQATMYATGAQGETLKRTLDADDIAGVQSIYGAGSTGPSATGVNLPACSAPPASNSPGGCKCSTTSAAPRAGALAGAIAAAIVAGLALARRRRAHIAAAVAALGVMAIAGSARATTMRTLSLKELAAESDAVVVGTISDVRVEGDATNVHTVNTIVVHELIAGRDFGTTLRVITPGGELGSIGLIASGIPHFTRGEEVALFAKHPAGAPDDVLVVPSLAQSAFEVVRLADGAVRLRRDLDDVRTVTRAPDGRLEPSLEDPLADLTLDALRSALR